MTDLKKHLLGTLSVTVLAATLTFTPTPAHAQGYPNFSPPKLIAEITGIIGKVKNLLEFPQQLKQLATIKDAIGSLKALASGDLDALGDLAGGITGTVEAAQTTSAAGQQAVEAASSGYEGGYEFYRTTYYAGPDMLIGENGAAIQERIRNARLQVLQQTAANHYSQALFHRTRIEKEVEEKVESLQQTVSDAAEIMPAIDANKTVTIASCEEMIPLISLEASKLELEALHMIKSDREMSWEGLAEAQ